MRRLLVLTALAAALTAGAQQRIVRLWNNASAPHDNGLRGGERVEEDRLFNTTEAVLYVYAADPARATGQAAVVCPGGGYRYCSPREADPVAVQFLQAGYHVFTLIYSTDHAPLLWQPLTEAASAILYLRRNAADLRIAADKITIVGFSAGAHLAASTALLWDAAPVQQAHGITGTEARPNAVVLGYPVITSGKIAHRGSIENLCGADEALLQTMSLEYQVRPEVPPFFIWHTVEDQAVPVETSLLLAGALKENNVPFELHLFTHGGHGSSTCTYVVNTPI